MGFRSTYERNWKRLMIFPMLFLIFSGGVLYSNYLTTGEFIEKDVSLKGGYLLTIESSTVIDISELEKRVSEGIGEQVKVRALKTLGSGKTMGYSFEYGGTEIDKLIDEVSLSVGPITGKSIEEISSAISERFWNGTLRAISVAILAMSGVVLLYFRLFVPAIAIILSGLSNIFGTLAIMSLAGISISTSGIAAILMLLGYSIDSNIVLTARALNRKEMKLEDRIFSAVKTGLTMSITSIVALLVLFLTSPAGILKNIAVILIIGLVLDIINTWIQNAGILRMYLRRGEKTK